MNRELDFYYKSVLSLVGFVILAIILHYFRIDLIHHQYLLSNQYLINKCLNYVNLNRSHYYVNFRIQRNV